MKQKMTRCWFVSVYFIFFVVLFCWTAEADATAGGPKRTTLFEGRKVTIPHGVGGMPDKNEISSFDSLELFEVGDAVVAIANAQFENDGKHYIGIAAVVMNKEGKCGTTSTFSKNYLTKQDDVLLFNPTVVVTKDNNGVSVIFSGYERQNEASEEIVTAGVSWEPLMAGGSIEDETGNTDTNKIKKIVWQDKIELVEKSFFVDKKKVYSKRFSQECLNAFLGEKGMNIQLKSGNHVVKVPGVTADEKNVYFTAFPKNKDAWKIYQEKHLDTISCFDPVIIKWTGNKKFMVAPCDDGNYRVFEASDNNCQWNVYDGMLSGVWGNNKNREGPGIRAGFTSAEIDGRTVAFFTQPMQNEGGENDYQLHLWLTDMNHTHDIGKISNENENVGSSTLLYKKGENTEGEKLYCLYEVDKEGGKKDIVFIDLTDRLDNIREVLKKWKDADDMVVRLFSSSGGVSPVRSRSHFFPTNNLVSYFAKTSTNKGMWVDNYLHMNAKIEKGTPFLNGLTFSGPGAGAKWEMNTGKQNRLYHFANYKFTLVATVKIHKEPTSGSSLPLLGIALYQEDGGTKRVGLCYTNERKWSVLDEFSKKTEETEKIEEYREWNIEKLHQVAMSFSMREFNLYVDGKRIFDDDYEKDSTVELDQSLNISHIYIGGYGNYKTAIDATVTNVFVYAQELYPENLDTLRKNTAISTEQDIQHRYKPVEEKTKEVTHIENPGYSEIESRIVEPSSAATLQPPIQQPPPPPPPPPPPQVPQAPLPLTQAQKQSRKDILEKTKQEKKQEERSTVSAKKDVAENTENDISRGKDEEHAASVRESIAQLPTDVQSKGEIADGPQDNLSQIDVAERNVQGEEEKQIDEKEVKLQPEAQEEDTKLAPSSTSIQPVAGGDMQSAAPASQPHRNTTSVNISSIAEMIAKSGGGGDGTVRERVSLVLLLMGFLAFLAAPH